MTEEQQHAKNMEELSDLLRDLRAYGRISEAKRLDYGKSLAEARTMFRNKVKNQGTQTSML